ncbi:MAG: hypothetical protein AAF204_00470 [Pseudomonadota bacterium]
MSGVVKDIESIRMPSLSKSTASSRELVFTGECPQAEAVGELRMLSEFTNPSDPSDANLISNISIENVNDTCSYEENTVTIDLKMDFRGTIGPMGRSAGSPSFSYPFFVAVTAANGDILAKEIFAANLTYPPGQQTQGYTEKLRQIIPIESKRRGKDFKVLVGFQLTPDQLAYNRQQIAQRLAAEQLAREAAKGKTPNALQRDVENAQQQVQQQAPQQIYIGRPVDITP